MLTVVFMYVFYVKVYIYIYIHIFMHVHVHVHVHVSQYIYIYIYVCVYVCATRLNRVSLYIPPGRGDCLRSVVRREGLWGLYRSMPTTLAPSACLTCAQSSFTLRFGQNPSFLYCNLRVYNSKDPTKNSERSCYQTLYDLGFLGPCSC